MDERGRPFINSAGVFYRLATIVLVVGILYFLSQVLLPFALAVLLTFVLTPAVRRLERWGVPRVGAVIVVSVGMGLFATLAVLGVAGQVVSFSSELDDYRENISHKLAAARETLSPYLARLETSSDYVDRLIEETAPDNTETSKAPAAAAAEQPTPAGAQESARRRLLGYAVEWLGPILSPLGTAAIVAVFAIFMLIEREDLRNRLIVLLGVDRVPGTTQLLDEAVRRVSRYLRMQLTVNLIYGASLTAISLAVGLPSAFLWGAMGAVLRFIPYFGPVLAAAFPLIVALAVTDGWTAILVLAGAILVLELIVNNFLEPWLYGSSVGVSPLGILVSAFFWAWLWGIPGLILATPITAVITVLARHIPALGWLATLLGDDPPLSSEDQLYQRLLAGDAHESLRIAEAQVAAEQENNLMPVCGALLSVLQRATADVTSGAVERQHLTEFLVTYAEVVEDLREDWRPAADRTEAGLASGRIVCLSARGSGNAEAAQVASLALTQAGWEAHAEVRTGLTSDQVLAGAAADVNALVVVSIGPRALPHARYVLHSIRAIGGQGAHVLIARPQGIDEADIAELRRHGAAEVATSLEELHAGLRTRLATNAPGPLAAPSTEESALTAVAAAH